MKFESENMNQTIDKLGNELSNYVDAKYRDSETPPPHENLSRVSPQVIMLFV